MEASQPTGGIARPGERHERSGLGITAKIFVSTVGIVVLAIGGAVAWTTMRADALMDKGVRDAFASTRHVFDNTQQERFDKLQRMNALVAEDPTFRAVILDTDEATLRDDLQRRKEQLGADLVIVANSEGGLLARTDGDLRAGETLASSPLVAKAIEGSSAAGLLADRGHLYHAVALPVGIGGEELAGVLVSGYLLDDRLAGEMKRTTGTEVAFVSDQDGKPALAASTLSSPAETASVLAFAAGGAANPSSDPQRVDVGGKSYLGLVQPLQTPEGERVGSLLVFRTIAAELASFLQLRRSMLVIGLIAALLALVVSYLLASRMTRPLVTLASVARSVTEGKYDVDVPAKGGDEVGALGVAIRAMVRELREKAELEKYLRELGVDSPTRTRVAPRPADGAQSAAAAPGREPAVGELFANRYDILEVIATGGMGTVYKAHDRELDDVVALKTIRKDAVGTSSDVMDRFKQEIKLARKATHKNIVRTYDFGDAGGVQYLTMEYVKGYTLRDLIRRNPDMPLGIALRIAKQICTGLYVAHQAGIIHRDVKSQNIIIQSTGELKIMDFGIARHVQASGMTEAGSVLGTPEFIAPEQATGKETDARSDIYSAGCVFFELFAGRTPFASQNAMEMMMKHVREEPPTLRSVKPTASPEVEAIVARMIRKDPAQRFQSFAEVHAALVAVPVPKPAREAA